MCNAWGLGVSSSATFEIKPLVYNWHWMCEWRPMHDLALSGKASQMLQWEDILQCELLLWASLVPKDNVEESLYIYLYKGSSIYRIYLCLSTYINDIY